MLSYVTCVNAFDTRRDNSVVTLLIILQIVSVWRRKRNTSRFKYPWEENCCLHPIISDDFRSLLQLILRKIYEKFFSVSAYAERKHTDCMTLALYQKVREWIKRGEKPKKSLNTLSKQYYQRLFSTLCSSLVKKKRKKYYRNMFLHLHHHTLAAVFHF